MRRNERFFRLKGKPNTEGGSIVTNMFDFVNFNRYELRRRTAYKLGQHNK